MRTAVIFDNFGPYHFARFQAASSVVDLLAIEVGGLSAEYGWKNITDDEEYKGQQRCHFKMETLFKGITSRELKRDELTRRLNTTLDDFHPEVVCIPGWSSRTALLALRWCINNDVNAVVMSDSTEWDDLRVYWKEFVKRKLINLCTAALVAGAPHKYYIVKLGMPSDRVFLGYDVVDNQYFANGAEESAKWKSQNGNLYKLPTNYFLASSRFIDKKNLPFLLRAYARYRKESAVEYHNSLSRRQTCNLWDLVVLGDGPLRSDLLRQVSDLQLNAFVHFPGFKQYPELPYYYSHANVFVHASTTDQWGLVVNEAMASGLPVLISNRCGCASDLVEQGKNGFTFNPFDEQELAQLMVKISGNTVSLKTMVVRSREIIENWCPNRFARSMKQTCEVALATRRHGSHCVSRIILEIAILLPENIFNRSTKDTQLGAQIKRAHPAITVKPNFFIIGAPKSGTTSLSQYIKDHPNIYFSKVKEPHFFDLDASKRLKINLRTYLSIFSDAVPNVHRAVGEGSTGYLFSKVAVSEILKFNPDAKFIVMLRNPVELVRAWHSQMYFEGVEKVREFEAAWRLEGERRCGKKIPRACWEPKKLLYSEWGKLGDQMERLFAVVNRDSVKVILFDDFVANTGRIYEEVLVFLGLPSDGRTAFPQINENRRLKYPGFQRKLALLANYVRLMRATSGCKMSLGLGLFNKALLLNSSADLRQCISPALREEIAEFYRDDIRKLSKLLGRDLSDWLVSAKKQYQVE